ncbi:2'-5' RNA ligase family protein [Agrococcus jejuensis]|nr:2'-5' RNA ligase family protein [Agrococcus jejuensis]
MLAPIRPGVSFACAAWPAHVTLASNLRLDDPTTLPGVVDDALRDVGSLDARLGRMAWFGEREDVPVLLVASTGIERAHERLATALVQLPGFAADAPRQWRAGYRPHLTLGAAVPMPTGDRVAIACVAIARLDGADAVVEAVLPPPAARRAAS